MHKNLFGGVFAILALVAQPAFATGPEAVEVTEEATVVAPEVAVEPAAELPEGGSCQEAVEQSGPCPYGAPTCETSEECDDWCGAPGFGLCEIQHWHGCCTCFG